MNEFRKKPDGYHKFGTGTRFAIFFLILSSSSLNAQSSTYFSSAELAIGGYDPVAYFTQSMAVMGSSEFSADWNGAKWLFSSAESREQFVANPNAYAPQFGGYCAYAAAKGSIAPTDPQAWTIHEGKLYLNYSRRIRRIWQQNIEQNLDAASVNWPRISSNLIGN